MNDIPTSFLQETIKVWQPFSKEPLTLEDAREIVSNMVGFFEVLMEWDAEKKKVIEDERNDNRRSGVFFSPPE